MNTFYIWTCTVVYLFSLRHDLFIFCFLPRFVGYIEFKGLELHASKLYGELRTIHGKYCFFGCTCHMFHSYNFHLRRWLASEPSPSFAKFKERVHISCVLGPVQLTTGPNFLARYSPHAWNWSPNPSPTHCSPILIVKFSFFFFPNSDPSHLSPLKLGPAYRVSH